MSQPSEVSEPICIASIEANDGTYVYTEGAIYKLPNGKLIALPQKDDLSYSYKKAVLFPEDTPALLKAQKESNEEFVTLSLADIGIDWGPLAEEKDVLWLKQKIEERRGYIKEIMKTTSSKSGNHS